MDFIYLQGYIWNPEIGELLICKQEFGNVHDPYAISVVHDDVVVGNVPQNILSLCHLRNGIILC